MFKSPSIELIQIDSDRSPKVLLNITRELSSSESRISLASFIWLSWVISLNHSFISLGNFPSWVSAGHTRVTLPPLTPSIVLSAMIIDWLWPSDAIWRHRYGSTLYQVVACCLTVPSHYMNKSWFATKKVTWYPPENNFTRDSLKSTWIKFISKLSGTNDLMTLGCWLF